MQWGSSLPTDTIERTVLKWWQRAIDDFGLSYSPAFQAAAVEAGFVMVRIATPGDCVFDDIPYYSYDDLEALYEWMRVNDVDTSDYVVEASSSSYIVFSNNSLAVQWKLLFPQYLAERKKRPR